MADFCTHHCGTRTIPELEAREAELHKRGSLSPHLQKELKRVSETLDFKRKMGGELAPIPPQSD
jgi:hypothetical protein